MCLTSSGTICIQPSTSKVKSNESSRVNLKFLLSFQAPTKRSQRNISQHCWEQHVARVWPSCCACVVHVGCCWFKFDHLQTWANNTQHVAIRRNMVAKRTQDVAPNNVAICCFDMLRSFGRGLIHIRKKPKANTSADWLKTAFLLLDRNTELAQAVDVMMAQAKRIYKVNNLIFFFALRYFLKEIGNMFSAFLPS